MSSWKPLLLCCVSGLLVAFGTSELTSAEPNRPNVILIYTDDQGYGDASYVNAHSQFQTPHLDKLAASGIVFRDGHSSDTVCTPSRYGLLTGRYSWRTELKRGVFGAERACLITDDRLTLASLLRGQGYATAMVGKWHLGMDFPGQHGRRDWSQPVLDMPLDKGFDYFWGIPASMNYGVLAWFEGRHPLTPPTLYTRKKPNEIALNDYRIQPPYQQKPRQPRDLEVAPDFVDSACLTKFTDQAIKWIQQQAPAARSGKPFFLYLPYTSPHKPVIPLEQFRGKSQAGAYGDFMIETDWHLGRLLAALDEEKLRNDTLVIFTSDNGPENTWREREQRFQHRSAGPFREGKRSIYEGGHRVPFIISWPAGVPAGGICDQPVCQTDLLATLAEVVGAELPQDAGEDSISLMPVLKNPRQELNRPPVVHHSSQGRFAIRQGDWKLVMQSRRQPQELYNLKSDPGEQHDLIAQHPQRAQRLQAELTRIVQAGGTRPDVTTRNDTPHWPDLTWIQPDP